MPKRLGIKLDTCAFLDSKKLGALFLTAKLFSVVLSLTAPLKQQSLFSRCSINGR